MANDTDILMSETINDRTYVVRKADHWPFKFWVGPMDGNADGKRARSEDEAIEIFAGMVG